MNIEIRHQETNSTDSSVMPTNNNPQPLALESDKKETAMNACSFTQTISCLVTLVLLIAVAVPAATVSYSASPLMSNTTTDFNISLFPGKASYAGLVSGTFGDGTAEAYQLVANVDDGGGESTNNNIFVYAEKGNWSGTPTYTNTSDVRDYDLYRGDIWTTNDPGTNFSGGDDANFGGTTWTISGAAGTSTTLSLPGYISGTGTVYILAGGYDTPFQTGITLNDGALNPSATSGSIDPSTQRILYLNTFTFDLGGTTGNYTLNFTYTGSTGARARYMGVVVDYELPTFNNLTWNGPATGGTWDADPEWIGDDTTWGDYSKATFTGATVDLGTDIKASGLVFSTAASTITDTGNDNTLTLDGPSPVITTNVNGTISARLAGGTDITQNGGATLTLSGNTTAYTGTVTVTDNSTLDGTGSFSGSVVLQGGSTLEVGTDSRTSWTLGADSVLTLADGAVWNLDLDSGGIDQILGSNAILDLPEGGTVNINITGLAGYVPEKGSVFTVFAGNIQDEELFNTVTFNISGPGGTWQAAPGSLTLTLIPEPSTIILAGLGLLGVTFRRRRSA